MRKSFRYLGVPVLLLGMAAVACSNSADSGEGSGSAGASGATDTNCPADFKVGLALDVGGLGDKSFNDAAYAGAQQAVADGLLCQDDLKTVETNESGSNRDDNVQALAQAGYQLIIANGYTFSDGVAAIAADYPDVDFAITDGYATTLPGGKGAPNVTDLTFKENESSYLVGIAAAMQAQKLDCKNVGFLGGQTGPLIEKFQAGYTAGVASVDPDITVQVEYIGDSVQAYTNPTAGKALSEKMYDGGACVIFHAAAASGAGLFQAAAERHLYAIGVDSDQYLTAAADQQPYIITSAIKRVDTTSYNAIKQAGSDTFKSGFQVFGLVDAGVGFADSNPKLLTPDMVSAMEAAQAKIISGDITVPDKP